MSKLSNTMISEIRRGPFDGVELLTVKRSWCFSEMDDEDAETMGWLWTDGYTENCIVRMIFGDGESECDRFIQPWERRRCWI